MVQMSLTNFYFDAVNTDRANSMKWWLLLFSFFGHTVHWCHWCESCECWKKYLSWNIQKRIKQFRYKMVQLRAFFSADLRPCELLNQLISRMGRKSEEFRQSDRNISHCATLPPNLKKFAKNMKSIQKIIRKFGHMF